MISSLVLALISAFKARRELALERNSRVLAQDGVTETKTGVLPLLSVGEMTLRLYGCIQLQPK